VSAGGFVVGMLRLATLMVLAGIAAHGLRRRSFSGPRATALLIDLVLAASLLLVATELLGLVSIDRFGPIAGLLALAAGIVWLLTPRTARSSLRAARQRPPRRLGTYGLVTVVGVVVVAGQWLVPTANSLGGGMFNFDTLWYHMPFAARFFQTGSVTGIHFTQADPFTAYYPANSELFHALGLVALHNDFASPFLNLLWLGIALLACWCVGQRWALQRMTLLAGVVVMGLPVLSTTQPGEAFNDVVGLAMLLAAIALLAYPTPGLITTVTAGLALGIAVGTKYTFLIPAAVLVVGFTLAARRGFRSRTAVLLVVPLLLTGCWWYVRNAIAAGDPLGIRLHIGPVHLPGPRSPLAAASSQTVFSEVRHLSLWGSRFAPGLEHALGPLWPLILALYVLAVIAGLWRTREGTVMTLAVAAALAGISYLFLPTGAQDLVAGTSVFQVNVRYATPALALGFLLIPILVGLRFERGMGAVALLLLAVLLLSQLESSAWLTQTGRHVAFLALAALATAVAFGVARVAFSRPVLVSGVVVVALLAAGAAAYALQRHYFARRYLVAVKTDPGRGTIYRWAQSVSHARIALYGDVRQYPLYGARDTNRVDYLGSPAPDGGYRPISSCTAWRTALARGHYRYLVLTPAPTPNVPLWWSTSDPALTRILHPTPSDAVFRVTGGAGIGRCDLLR
jgi:hypothetical protein